MATNKILETGILVHTVQNTHDVKTLALNSDACNLETFNADFSGILMTFLETEVPKLPDCLPFFGDCMVR